jgi:hypothetical protein
MRQLFIFFIVFVGQTSIGYSQAPYKINSCKIDFFFAAGTFQKGTKTLIFIDSGRIEKEFGVTYRDTSANSEIPKEVIGDRTVYRALLIHTIDSVFSVDLDLMTGSKRVKFGFGSSSFMDDQMKKVREDTFLNRKCDVIDFNGVRLWYWKGIVLKKELGIDGVYEYATSIDENYIIKDDEFQVPKDIKMQ